MKLIYEEYLPNYNKTSFINTVIDYCQSLHIDPNWLMAVMYFETAGTFDPSIQNQKTKATGLIQFMPNTANGLETSIEELAQLSAEDQMYYVYRYYYPYRNRIKSYTDLYLATFFPAAIGKSAAYVLQTSNLSANIIADANPIFDINQDQQITKVEVEKVILDKLPQQWRAAFASNKTSNKKSGSLFKKISGLGVLLLLISKIS